MSLSRQLAKVRRAQARMDIARHALSTPALALLARGRQHPLTTMGTAAGAGFVLGCLNVRALRVPGMASMLGGGLLEAVAYGTRLITELGMEQAGRGTRSRDSPDHTIDSGSANEVDSP